MTEATIEFACPLCARITRVPSAFAGKQGKCPGCRQVIEVPDPNAPPPPPASDPALDAGGLATAAMPMEPPPAPEAIGTPVEDVGTAPLRLRPSERTAPTSPAAPPGDVPPGHRACRECGQAIRAAALKCRHCGHIEDKPCPACGEQIKATAKKCRFCGEFLDESMRTRRRQGGQEYRLASHGARLGAYLLDEVVLAAPALVLWVLFAAWIDRGSTKDMGTVAGLAGCAWYLSLTGIQWYRTATTGQTIAKRWLGIKIVRTDGTPVDFVHGVILRNWISGTISNFCCLFYLIGLLCKLVDSLMIFAEDRRTLHDHFASTRVIEVGSDRQA